MLRLLQFLLILAVIRAVWRLAKGVLEGAGYQRVHLIFPMCNLICWHQTRARSDLRDIRVAKQGPGAEGWRPHALFLLRQVPSRMGAAVRGVDG